MDWIKVVTGFILMGGLLIGWYRLMRHLKGGDGGQGMKLDVGRGRRGRAASTNELEQFVASHRAAAGTPSPTDTLASDVAPPLPVDAARGTTAAGQPTPIPTASAFSSDPAATPPSPGAASPAPLLSGHARLAFLLFRTALPDHHIFPRVALGAVVADAGIARGHVFTLIVCRSDLAVVAAVDLRASEAAGPAVAAAIARAGLRHVVLDPARLPRRDAVRALLGLD